MKRLLFLFACILALAVSGHAQPQFQYRIDFNDYQPNAGFYVGMMYGTQYNEVFYVMDVIKTREGMPVLVIQNLVGKTCKYTTICAIDISTRRGSLYFPVYYR